MTYIEEMLIANPALLRRVLEVAIDACWSAIECAALRELDGDKEWMALGEDLRCVRSEVSLLTALGLLQSHPAHADWVIEIAALGSRR